ncbi:TetR/AcrR family transcriptional regulator [Telluria mixta]|uniref:TetR/AcrR family transcriptional regulator n=1 Tax=Telluria mixta TaxID=34071 RepID=A0ABT2BS30_9BURK|nr:TetR/AcrR family transcriptional regulator [Telluria mixta]MCS0627929.1 TetR/AcrR family transcriptional regulator [Telluria mixta]WEM93952.1 TetR/AcrR family transcriptional regulator [Telluria mixta]
MATIDVLERNFPGRRAQLKREILLGALACFNEHGLDVTTIEMIKVRCDTSVGNIYHHFGSKEGLAAALFFSSLEDQGRLLSEYLEKAQTAQEGVSAIVYSYVDWVANQPELASFQYQGRSMVAKGPYSDELTARNRSRNQNLLNWWNVPGRRELIKSIPLELFPSLIIGQAESYCRAWLSGRVHTTPTAYRAHLAQAAWLSLGTDVQGNS